ncbi:glycosyltransferase family 2 protein [Bartonella sp. LJL80]
MTTKNTAVANLEKQQDRSVAVIIPYYNGSKYIERSAKSVLEQTIKPDEFVVVDDGSTPEEAAFLDKIGAQMGFTVLHKENGGQGSARNFGVAHTKSRFISFLDQDDFYLLQHIEILLDEVVWDDPRFGWVYGDLYEADEEGNIILTDIVTRYTKDSHPKKNIYSMLRNDMFVLPSASLICRTAYEDVGGFDPQFTGYEDDDLFLRLFRSGWSNYFTPKSVTVWCVNSNSTSYSIKMSRSRLRYIKKICENFPEEDRLGRSYIRDCLVPRFMDTIIKEARFAVAKPKTPQQFKINETRDEFVSILDDFNMLIRKYTRLKSALRWKIKRRTFKIKLKYKWNSLFRD